MESDFCPSCGAALQADRRGGLLCAGCGAVVAEPFTLCPRCGYRNEKGAAACDQCGGDLTAFCPGCGQINWNGTDRCSGCGRELDTLGHVFRPLAASVQIRQEELIKRVPALREKGEQESRARLDVLLEVDRRRMQRSAEAAARARLRERRIIISAGVAVVGLVILILLAEIIFF